jgi:tRNA(fMet)-specific endonuclease VapC
VIRFLLDTNIISEPLRIEPNHSVLQNMVKYELEIAMASITWHELLFGYYRLPHSKKKNKITNYLHQVIKPKIPILHYDGVAAEWFANERARLVGVGKTPAYPDGQIAAIAKTNNLILVTNNVADFSEFQNLKIENWFVDENN